MAKMSELDAALKALLEYSEGIQETVRGIRALLTDDAANSMEAVQASKKEQPTMATEPEKTYTLQEVRALLRDKTGKGFMAEVKALLRAHGAERLPDIDPQEYPAMMKEAEGIGA